MNKYVWKKFYNEIDNLRDEYNIRDMHHAIQTALVNVDATKNFELAIFDIEINKGNIDVANEYTNLYSIAYKLTEQGKEEFSIFIL